MRDQISQIHQAWRLAREFGHEWARLEWGEVETLGCDPERIEERIVSGRGEHSLPGISSPGGGRGEFVSHITGTGRCQWDISPEGEVTVTISRHLGEEIVDCLRAVHTLGEYEPKVEVLAPYARRHLRALAKALLAVAHHSEDTFMALAHLWAEAETDPWDEEVVPPEEEEKSA